MSRYDAEQRSVRRVALRTCGSDVNTQAERLFNVIDEDGSQAIVLVPERRCVCSCLLTIPASCACIVQKAGVNLGVWNAGLHCANYLYDVVFVVTKQTTTYNYDIVECPTHDNVMVEVDITLSFTIFNPEAFVYLLGATHFDDLLKALAEEAIRTLVRSIDHTRIYGLRSSAADILLQILNHSFKDFGVKFNSATVTKCKLPADLDEALESASKINSQMQEQIRSQEFEIKKLNDKADLELKELVLREERVEADLVAKKDRMVIEMETKLTEAQRKAERILIKNRQLAESLKVKARASLRDDQTKAQTEAEQALQKANSEVKQTQREIDQWAAEELLQAEAKLAEAEAKAAMLKMEADAEARALEDLRASRAYKMKMATLEALMDLARSGKIIMAGKTGETLVKALAEGSVQWP
ncbi:hypothetical protein Pelo_7509 [Pelomyxa schiedti]|nr:hypothetical protein Pelo_7509 [Pelomyxa schiedti]